MKTRIITAAVALIVLAAVLIAPSGVFNAAICAVIFIMLHECYSSAKASKKIRVAGFVSAWIILLTVCYSIFENVAIWNNKFITPAIMLGVLIHMGVTVWEHGKSDYTKVLSSGFLTLYVTMSMSCLALTKAEYGTWMLMLIFVCAWLTDTGAYFTGRALGKHKLIPHVSPNKTVEGAVGGVITAIVSCIVYFMLYVKFAEGGTLSGWLPFVFVAGAVIGGVSSVFAQLGDLAASAIKRDTGVKDFGKIFPGHGGFMDRFDSVLFIAPIIYALLHILLQ